MKRVGVKTLRDHLSGYVRRAREGERIVVTDHGKPVATLTALEESKESRWAWELVKKGIASWGGGKPAGSRNPPRPRGRTAAQIVLEDRR